MGFADLHIHSIYSYDGIIPVPAILKYAANDTFLDVIAITDHDSMCGVSQAMDLAPKYGIEVVPGCEISTAEGHLLCLFIDEPAPPSLSLMETIKIVGEMGGICIAAHPTARGTSSLSFEAIRKAVRTQRTLGIFVGIEAYNAGLVYQSKNSLVAEKSAEIPLAQVGNSDAHILNVIGLGSTHFEGSTAQDLRKALVRKNTSVWKSPGMSGAHVLTSYVLRLMLRKMGWVPWNEAPSAPLTRTRVSKLQAECE
jgi:predicted metal-dependent phosphoesterase TrpH